MVSKKFTSIFANSFRRTIKHPLFGPTYYSKLPPLTMPQLHSQCEILLQKEIFQQSFIKTILGKKKGTLWKWWHHSQWHHWNKRSTLCLGNSLYSDSSGLLKKKEKNIKNTYNLSFWKKHMITTTHISIVITMLMER